ncbi:MAG: sugar transferase [Clostridia bacterium]|nr:sugar transferase [Clostridia bacterium]
MLEFLSTPAGIAILIIFIVIVLLLIIEVNYKFFMKVALDFLVGLIGTIIWSPGLIACTIISRKRTGEGLISKPYLGYKGKVVYLHEFAGIESRMKYCCRLFDMLSGRLSVVGVTPMNVEDGAFMDDNQLDRFNARPGVFSCLITWGSDDLTYEEMFALDAKYASKREMFFDLWILIRHAVGFCRGERKADYLGETIGCDYTAKLLERGQIHEADVQRAKECAEEAIENREKEKEFKKQRTANLYNTNSDNPGNPNSPSGRQ